MPIFSDTYLNHMQAMQLIGQFIELAKSGKINTPKAIDSLIETFKLDCELNDKINGQECVVYDNSDDAPSITPVLWLGMNDKKVIAVTYNNDTLDLLNQYGWHCSFDDTRLPICSNDDAEQGLQKRWDNYFNQLLKAAN